MTGSWKVASTRYAIYHRDGFACVYCGDSHANRALLTLDHVITREAVKSGKAPPPVLGVHHESNLVTACMTCNVARGELLLEDWYDALRAMGVPAKEVQTIQRRVARQLTQPIDRKLGRELAKARTPPTWGFAKYRPK